LGVVTGANLISRRPTAGVLMKTETPLTVSSAGGVSFIRRLAV
jgi:hypothetical protein